MRSRAGRCRALSRGTEESLKEFRKHKALQAAYNEILKEEKVFHSNVHRTQLLILGMRKRRI